MATTGTFALERADGTVAMVYSHWDNYLECNGLLLQEHYNTVLAVQALIDLGDISSLGSELGEAHAFDEYFNTEDPRSNWTKAYGRDRGETNIEARIFDSYAHYCRDAEMQEYNYLFRNGIWYVQCQHLGSGARYELSEAFEILAADQAA
jgi:hypothetical protein